MARAVLLIEALEVEDRRFQSRTTARLRRSLRDQAKALELSDSEFKAHYRLTKELFQDLCTELKPYMVASRRKTKINVECKVLTALSFYATGSYQKPVGMSYLHGLCQASVSNAVKEVTMALNTYNMLKKYINFPGTRQERQAIINGFSNKYGFPGCLGCIDSTHVAMIRPTEHEERFFNRKHYHSRNVQIICDSDLNIINIDASFGGATHDAHIWKNSQISQHVQELHNRGEAVWLLGDSGYPLRPWLLTPIVNAEPVSAYEHYTNMHCLTRNTVERCIGVLKARWRCLLAHRVLHYNHHMVAKIINACAVLHNMCNRHRLPIPQLPSSDILEDQNNQIPQQPLQGVAVGAEQQLLASGRQQRELIVQRLWSAPRP
ncbi:unnamed protein product [Parnassius mnemosyne]|uniref:DDE Tnp4 domain-containing protein n=1 Tax=Parnassius mnemosyne TaxID=213953 RepID=A0AAV1KCC1_9NEOP